MGTYDNKSLRKCFRGKRKLTGKWSKQQAELLLSQTYWFAAVPASMRRAILDRSEIRQFGRSASLYRIGDPVDGMYASLEGDIRAHAHGDHGERILLRLLGPGSWFGEFHLLDNYPARTFEVCAASECTALFLPKQGYDAITEESQEYYRHFVRLTCMHQRFMVRIALEARSDAAHRTARALIRIARMHGRNTERRTQLSINLTQSDLASLVGVSRQYLNELLSRWNEEGVLIWKGNAPPVLFLDRLRTLLTPLDDWMLESEGWA